jgi:DNA polymerase-3 subunit beta
MVIQIARESLLKPLQLINGVVERRQTLPILGNLLLKLVNDQLSITATDLEIEIVTHLLIPVSKNGEITLPARKFMDICKALPDEAQITIKTEGERITIRSGKSRFTLSTLPASEFPNIDNFDSILEFTIPQIRLKTLIDQTHFAMAQQDVRYYLNGLLLEFSENQIRAVATDGHRLALCDVKANIQISELQQIIVPRKAVMELSRLLENSETLITIQLSFLSYLILF